IRPAERTSVNSAVVGSDGQVHPRGRGSRPLAEAQGSADPGRSWTQGTAPGTSARPLSPQRGLPRVVSPSSAGSAYDRTAHQRGHGRKDTADMASQGVRRWIRRLLPLTIVAILVVVGAWPGAANADPEGGTASLRADLDQAVRGYL